MARRRHTGTADGDRVDDRTALPPMLSTVGPPLTGALPLLTGALPPLSGGHFLGTTFGPLPVAVVAAALALYLWGVARANRLHPRHPWPARRTAAFAGGILATAFALFSFVGAYDTVLFWDHMVQHLTLIMVAAPLFAASSPITLLLRATKGASHRRVAASLRSGPARVIGHPGAAFLLYAIVVPVFHLTSLFNQSLTTETVHGLEHLSFLIVGYLFWRLIFETDRNRRKVHPAFRAVLLFFALPVDTFVGLTLNSETHEIFPALAAVHRSWGPSLLQDLHTGGVIMWVGGDVLMMLGLIPVIVQWVRFEERRTRRVDTFLGQHLPAPAAVGAEAGQPTAGFALGTYAPRRSARAAQRRSDRAAPPATPSARSVG